MVDGCGGSCKPCRPVLPVLCAGVAARRMCRTLASFSKAASMLPPRRVSRCMQRSKHDAALCASEECSTVVAWLEVMKMDSNGCYVRSARRWSAGGRSCTTRARSTSTARWRSWSRWGGVPSFVPPPAAPAAWIGGFPLKAVCLVALARLLHCCCLRCPGASCRQACNTACSGKAKVRQYAGVHAARLLWRRPRQPSRLARAPLACYSNQEGWVHCAGVHARR